MSRHASLSAAKRLRFAEIAHTLPPDCWAVRRNQRNPGEFDDEPVLALDGPSALDQLDLDDPLGDGSRVFLIHIQGDLDVAGAVVNENTDGAAGLIVSGSLRCRNAAVGGQEIYVRGDLDVAEMYWGDYNHGSLIVAGDAAARLFLVTEDYGVDLRGEHRVGRWIQADHDIGEGWPLDDPHALGEEIEAGFIAADDDDDDGPAVLLRDGILAALREGRRVLCAERDADAERIAALFPDPAISIDNIVRIVRPEWLYTSPEDPADSQVEFRDGDLFCRISLIPDGEKPVECKLYFQLGRQWAAMIGTFNEPLTRAGRRAALPGKLIGRLTGRARPQTLGLIWRDVANQGGWLVMDDSAPAEARALAERGWQAALRYAAAQSQLHEAVTPAMIRELLALPLAEPYDDYYCDDRNGLWVGDTYCSFRQESEEECPLLRVKAAGFHFYAAVRTADDGEKISLRYTPSLEADESGVSSDPDCTGGRELQRALRAFHTARRNLLRANRALLAGARVADDDFAVGHWRAKGYLRDWPP